MDVHLFRSFKSVVGTFSYLLVLPGRPWHGETARDHQTGEHLPKRAIYQSNSTSHVKVDPPLSMSNQLSKKYKAINTRRRVRGFYHCFLCSAYSDGNWVQPRKLDNLGFIDSQKLSSKHSTVTRTRADFKSEENDITGAASDSLASDGASEAISLGGVDTTKPWWQKFPKRWLMVLLCFAAFLLCNMDRVRSFFYWLWIF